MDLLTPDGLLHSASAKDGISASQERALRKEALVFVLELAIRVRVSQQAVATAQVLVHRVRLRQYTVFKSFLSVHRLQVAAACLFLACKINEQIRSLSVISEAFFDLERSKKMRKNPKLHLPEATDRMHQKLREDLITIESEVLQLIDFQMGEIELPYGGLKTVIRALELDPDTAEKLHKVAWNFANDSLRSQVYLLHPALEIAKVCVYLAGKYLNLDVSVVINADCLERVIEVYNDAVTTSIT